MSIIVPASWTTPQVEGVTRNEIFKRLLRNTGIGVYGTATGGSTTTIEDTNQLKSTQFSDREHVGGWGRIGKDASGGQAAPENEQSPITTYAPSTGIITLNPAITAVAANDEYQLWHMINPTMVKDMLDTLLVEEIYLPSWDILTEVPDGDMEQGNTTDWTDSNATGSKVTDEPRLSGIRSLEVVTSAINGYSRTVLLGVEPSKPYHVSALTMPQGAFTATLQVYDETNSAAIDSKTFTSRYPARIHFDFTTPSGCLQISVRLIGAENSSTIRWTDVVLYPTDARDIALPWWVKNKNQVREIFQLQPNEVKSNVWDGVLRGEKAIHWDIRDSAFGRGQLRVVARQGTMSNPLFILGIRNEVAFADDTADTKFIDANLIAAGLAFKVFSHLAKPTTRGVTNREYINEQLSTWQELWEGLLQQQAERVEEVITSPTPERAYLDPRFQFGFVDGSLSVRGL